LYAKLEDSKSQKTFKIRLKEIVSTGFLYRWWPDRPAMTLQV